MWNGSHPNSIPHHIQPQPNLGWYYVESYLIWLSGSIRNPQLPLCSIRTLPLNTHVLTPHPKRGLELQPEWLNQRLSSRGNFKWGTNQQSGEIDKPRWVSKLTGHRRVGAGKTMHTTLCKERRFPGSWLEWRQRSQMELLSKAFQQVLWLCVLLLARQKHSLLGE